MMLTKRELRQQILQKRDALSVKEHQIKSHAIAQKVLAGKAFHEASKVLSFVSFGSEVDTWEIISHALKFGKEVYVPKIEGREMSFYQIQGRDDLQEGYRGIREPKERAKRLCLEQSDEQLLVLIPGVVFDNAGNRIGYGGGYYDRYLRCMENCNVIISKIAVAYECQIVDDGQIPIEEHDIAPDCIITEERTVFVQSKFSL